MALIGYARVSTHEQDLALQLDALRAAGATRVFEDHGVSGARAERIGLGQALAFLRDGDTLVVWRLDRLGRSMTHLLQTVSELDAGGIGFRSLTETIDTTTPTGRLVFHVFGALGQFERDLIAERTRAGLTARGRTRPQGRPPGRGDAGQGCPCPPADRHGTDRAGGRDAREDRQVRPVRRAEGGPGYDAPGCGLTAQGVGADRGRTADGREGGPAVSIRTVAPAVSVRAGPDLPTPAGVTEPIARTRPARAARGLIPRMQGTPRDRRRRDDPRRAHPRAGGEHRPWTAVHYGKVGSSPRRRGTPQQWGGGGRADRLIPAQAGNTCSPPPRPSCDPAHPRAGGEHIARQSSALLPDGSSPRRRGTRRVGHALLDERRLIPAQAGNTARRLRQYVENPAHPRAGGEHRTPATPA